MPKAGERIVPVEIVRCTMCPIKFPLAAKQRGYWRKTGRAFCSPDCTTAARRAGGARGRMTAEGRAATSARMSAANPMARPEVRERVSAILRARGHRPPVRGGNGTGLTKPQRLLADLLGWETEIVLGTGTRGNGVPSHWKLDIGHSELKMAVEVDGPSHWALERQACDRRKAKFLADRGWLLVRFTNRQVLKDVHACVEKVLSIASARRG